MYKALAVNINKTGVVVLATGLLSTALAPRLAAMAKCFDLYYYCNNWMHLLCDQSDLFRRQSAFDWKIDFSTSFMSASYISWKWISSVVSSV